VSMNLSSSHNQFPGFTLILGVITNLASGGRVADRFDYRTFPKMIFFSHGTSEQA
jgi:hypothetical protein